MLKVKTQDVQMFHVVPSLILLDPQTCVSIRIAVRSAHVKAYLSKSRSHKYTFLFNELTVSPEEASSIRQGYVDSDEDPAAKKAYKERLQLSWKEFVGSRKPRDVNIFAESASQALDVPSGYGGSGEQVGGAVDTGEMQESSATEKRRVVEPVSGAGALEEREDLTLLAHKFIEEKSRGDLLYKANVAAIVTRDVR